MPKVTYPRPCPTCGKECGRKRTFFRHKKQCGTTENRYHCPNCPLSFSQKESMQRHIQQQHSKTPQRFTCPECNKEFTKKQSMKHHLESRVCFDVRPSFPCVFCRASFKHVESSEKHMRKTHGFIMREMQNDINLRLHLQHLSEEPDCKDEWMFVESRPIAKGEHHICPCGQTDIKAYFFLENKINGNRTFVGSTCIENIDPRVGRVVAYFKYILIHPIQGTYQGQDSGDLQRFTVESNTILVRDAEVVNHLNPQVIKTLEGKWEVLVKHPRSEALIEGQTYDLRLKAKYVRGKLTFTVV